MRKNRTMTPDIWMPFYWPKFQSDTIGMRRETKWSYFNAICAYWWGKCEGLSADDESLRLICECDSMDWARTRGQIFGVKFKLKDGLWHQKRAEEEYRDATAKIGAASARGRTGADARWHKPELHKQCSSNAQAIDGTMLADAPVPVPVPLPLSAPKPEPTHTQSESVGACVSAAPKPELPKPPQNGQATFDWLKGALCGLYRRDETARLNYSEESLLSEVSRRQKVKTEYGELRDYRLKLGKNIRYFPQSLERLLSSWDATLDKARSFTPAQTEKSLIDKEIERQMARAKAI